MKATVLIPTTKYRGVLLPFSVGSVLMQTVQELEIFIVGDGVDQETREVIEGLKSKDERISFFDYPKGERRGETYRNEVLIQHAQGSIVCYLLDRDLMLPDHVETMYKNLQEHNLCVHTSMSVTEEFDLFFVKKPFIGEYNRALSQPPFDLKWPPFYFSQVGHTLDFYKKLPFGWRTTPSNYPTDVYMWKQFVNHQEINLISTSDSTILYFKRGDHPGWPAEKRAQELRTFYPKLSSRVEIDLMRRTALDNLFRSRESLESAPLLIKGSPIWRLPARFLRMISRFFLKRR